jgi:hypothetical protein
VSSECARGHARTPAHTPALREGRRQSAHLNVVTPVTFPSPPSPWASSPLPSADYSSAVTSSTLLSHDQQLYISAFGCRLPLALPPATQPPGHPATQPPASCRRHIMYTPPPAAALSSPPRPRTSRRPLPAPVPPTTAAEASADRAYRRSLRCSRARRPALAAHSRVIKLPARPG